MRWKFKVAENIKTEVNYKFFKTVLNYFNTVEKILLNEFSYSISIRFQVNLMHSMLIVMIEFRKHRD